MPLSKCRFCGKKVPNPFRPHHEHMCVKRRLREGTYVSPESKRQAEKLRLKRLKEEEEERRNKPQRTMEAFSNTGLSERSVRES